MKILDAVKEIKLNDGMEYYDSDDGSFCPFGAFFFLVGGMSLKAYPPEATLAKKVLKIKFPLVYDRLSAMECHLMNAGDDNLYGTEDDRDIVKQELVDLFIELGAT